MKPKRLSLFPNSQQDTFRNDTKTFWFRFQKDIGTFVLSFLTLLYSVLMQEEECVEHVDLMFLFWDKSILYSNVRGSVLQFPSS
jgi:hypothetical protein